MSTFNGINSDFSSNFLNSYFGTSSTGSTFGTSMLSDYASIRNGSYYKLLKAYYAKEGTDTKATNKTNNDAAEKKNLSVAKTGAENLAKSSLALVESGSSSVFKKVSKTDEDGKITSEYDKDSIYKAVDVFVKDYNSVVNASADVDKEGVLQKTLWMVNGTKTFEKALSKAGITINSDNTLSLDEPKFKEANMTDVKSLFNGTNSLAAKTYTKASDIYNISNSAINSDGLYTNKASYSSNISTGSLFDSMF